MMILLHLLYYNVPDLPSGDHYDRLIMLLLVISTSTYYSCMTLLLVLILILVLITNAIMLLLVINTDTVTDNTLSPFSTLSLTFLPEA